VAVCQDAKVDLYPKFVLFVSGRQRNAWTNLAKTDAELLGEYKTIATTINDKALLYLVESPTVVWTEFSTDVSQHALGGSGRGNAHAVVLLKMPDKTVHVFNPDAKCPTRVNHVSPSGLRQFLLKFNNWRVVWHAGPGSSVNLDCRDHSPFYRTRSHKGCKTLP